MQYKIEGKLLNINYFFIFYPKTGKRRLRFVEKSCLKYT